MFDPGRVWFSILVSSLMLLVAAWLLSTGHVLSFPPFRSSGVNRMLALAGVVMFTYMLVQGGRGLVRVRRRTPALDLDSAGLTLRLFGPTRYVSWGDVTSVAVGGVRGDRVVVGTSKRDLYLIPANYQGDITAEELANRVRSYLAR